MTLHLKKGWSVIEDVHKMGEFYEIFKADFNPTLFGLPKMKAMSPWKPIGRLEHLQLTFAENPYYGFGLRQFNESPWWYRNEIEMEEETEFAVLQFHGVDYFADVWLNEQYLGSHEGYNTPFCFEVGDLLKKGKNLLIVKVRAPWDNVIVPGGEYDRFLMAIRDQMKGTYEHTDTFIPRDVNPIGIWDDVEVIVYNGLRIEPKPAVEVSLNDDYSKAETTIQYQLHSHLDIQAQYQLQIKEFNSEDVVAESSGSILLQKGTKSFSQSLPILNPKLWTIWERGDPNRYRVTLTVMAGADILLQDTQTFGIRKVEIIRNEKEVCFLLNGERVYLRGATYFPDAYISANSRQLYLRDLDNAKVCGLNALRIHVHSEKDELYDLCDSMGMLLMQDSDFNWTHPTDEEWTNRALKMYEEMVHRLKNHPSIFCWVCMNEPRLDSYLTERPGPQLMALTQELDPQRPFILSSWSINDPNSGDSHNYEGSLHGSHTHYTNIYGSLEKLNSEFGMDAPPIYSTLRHEPTACEILGDVVDGIDDIQYYQFRYLKYFIEHYRMQKFKPCGGHFQFLFTDTAPTSFFGVYDRFGIPKYAKRAFSESNLPVAIMMEAQRTKPEAVWIINDLLEAYPDVVASWQITDDENNVIDSGEKKLKLSANSLIKVCPLTFIPDDSKDYTVYLKLLDNKKSILAENIYESAFRHPDHTAGHPYLVHHGLALRTYWAWMDKNH